MKHSMRFAAGTLVVVASAGLVQCGGGDNGPSGHQATIDLTSVESGIAQVSSVLPICSAGGGGGSPLPAAASESMPWLATLLELRREGAIRETFSPQGLGSTKPADEFGECGGRMGYDSYSHTNGVTTGTLVFDNYCSINEDTGDRNISSGSITFVNTGTPSASGPITTKIEADSPDGITFVTRNAGGTQLSSHNVQFKDYLYRAGVPGGDPTAANPDRLSFTEIKVTNRTTGKIYRHTGYDVTVFNTAAGGQQVSATGRGYRSSGDYFQVATSTPLTSNAAGDILGGSFTFTGAENSTATMTMVPGTVLQATMRVNGTLVTNVPACR